jgi:hypothetical protein
VKVFNLTESPLDFRGRTIPADGGYLEYPELDVFIPNRDRELASAGVISFDYIPASWHAKKAIRILSIAREHGAKTVMTKKLSFSDKVQVKDAVKVEEIPWQRSSKRMK